MKKRVISVLMAALFVLSAAGMVFALEPNGNKRKGKYTYKNVYKACAQRGAVASKTPVLSPSDKTMSQWKRVFEKKKFDVFTCEDEFNALSEEDLLDIFTYLYNFAADSPSPAKCK